MTKPDDDMLRMSELFAEARLITGRRQWGVLAYSLDQEEAEAVLLGLKPGDGEKGTVEVRPARGSRCLLHRVSTQAATKPRLL